MDEPGFHARRRAEREARAAYKDGKLGHHGIKDTAPLEDWEALKHQIDVPAGAEGTAGGYEIPGYRPPPHVAPSEIPGVGVMPNLGPLPPGVVRRKMYPHLSMMTGPMLRYDTVKDNTWHGYLMIVTTDEGSDYDPIQPSALLEWDATPGGGFEHFQQYKPEEESDESVNRRHVNGIRIFTYHSLAGPQSFWRFKLEIPLTDREEEVFYSINNGQECSFWVPARHQNFRWVGHSCNGFSGGVDTAAFNGPDPLWRDVLREHAKQPIHVLIGGGDQIYCDPLTKEPEFVEWINEQDEKVKVAAALTPDMMLALDRFFFNHYCNWFRSGAFGESISKIPMLNICDDHDLIDGFGSYPDNLQSSPVFSTIGARGIFWYLLFQQFIVDDVDGTSPVPGSHPSKSCIIGGEGAWIPFPSHSFLSYLGPKVYILLLDCRIERKKDQICSDVTYQRVFQAIRELPSEVDHLIMLLGVPICYPRMNAIESVLESKYNPMSILAKAKLMPSAVNKFNAEAELLDDLNDHWTASHHKKERNQLIHDCQKLAVECRLRVTFLSGDVHACCVTKLHNVKKIEPAQDPKYMLQVVSSAIVNTPPPPPVIMMVSTLGKKRHKTLHYIDTDETLIDMFPEDTDGSKLKNTTVLGRRNYCLVNYVPETGEVDFSIQVEKSQGSGTTKGYAIRAPAPRWA